MPPIIKSSAKITDGFFKILIYGRPSKGKTMLTPTAPKPILLLTEPGGADSLTTRNIINVFGPPETEAAMVARFMKEGATKAEALAEAKASVITYDVPRLEVFTHAALAEAMDFLESDTSYETVLLDSASQLSKMLLVHFETKTKHGMRAYGQQAKQVTDVFHRLLHLNKHVVCFAQAAELSTKLGGVDDENAVEIRYLVPSFEGRQLKMAIPHLMGEIYQAEIKTGDDGNPVYFLRTRAEDPYGYEKSRMSILENEEEAHLGHIFAKLRSA